jgi:hypothetical protein
LIRILSVYSHSRFAAEGEMAKAQKIGVLVGWLLIKKQGRWISSALSF